MTEITFKNVAQLEMAWSNTSDPDTTSGTMYTSPIVIDGVRYGLSPSLVPFAAGHQLIALSGREADGMPRC